MIELTKLNHEKYYMNCELIELIEKMPDTLITTTTGKKYYALETPEEIITKVIDYKKNLYANCAFIRKHKEKGHTVSVEDVDSGTKR